MHGPFREITIPYIGKSVIFVLGMSVSYIVLRSGISTYPFSWGKNQWSVLRCSCFWNSHRIYCKMRIFGGYYI